MISSCIEQIVKADLGNIDIQFDKFRHRAHIKHKCAGNCCEIPVLEIIAGICCETPVLEIIAGSCCETPVLQMTEHDFSKGTGKRANLGMALFWKIDQKKV